MAKVRVGQRVLFDDGRLQARVANVSGESCQLTVEVGGTLLPNKGINLPDSELNIPAVTRRDRDALAIAAKAGVDWIALSFVRDASAAAELRGVARAYGLEVPIIAKMERPEAVKRAEDIIAAFDGIMVARGDLGVEIPLERVPHVQKRLIHLSRTAGKPVITATDMLDSMRSNPRPTRAEASDVANAVYDGTDAVMLSAKPPLANIPSRRCAAWTTSCAKPKAIMKTTAPAISPCEGKPDRQHHGDDRRTRGRDRGRSHRGADDHEPNRPQRRPPPPKCRIIAVSTQEEIVASKRSFGACKR